MTERPAHGALGALLYRDDDSRGGWSLEPRYLEVYRTDAVTERVTKGLQMASTLPRAARRAQVIS